MKQNSARRSDLYNTGGNGDEKAAVFVKVLEERYQVQASPGLEEAASALLFFYTVHSKVTTCGELQSLGKGGHQEIGNELEDEVGEKRKSRECHQNL